MLSTHAYSNLSPPFHIECRLSSNTLFLAQHRVRAQYTIDAICNINAHGVYDFIVFSKFGMQSYPDIVLFEYGLPFGPPPQPSPQTKQATPHLRRDGLFGYLLLTLGNTSEAARVRRRRGRAPSTSSPRSCRTLRRFLRRTPPDKPAALPTSRARPRVSTCS